MIRSESQARMMMFGLLKVAWWLVILWVLALGIKRKFDFWLRLPWLLCALAYWVVAMTRRCAAEALRL